MPTVPPDECVDGEMLRSRRLDHEILGMKDYHSSIRAEEVLHSLLLRIASSIGFVANVERRTSGAPASSERCFESLDRWRIGSPRIGKLVEVFVVARLSTTGDVEPKSK